MKRDTIIAEERTGCRAIPPCPFVLRFQLPSANKTRGEREMLYCLSSARTERTDCKPNTVFARGKTTLPACLTLYARVHTHCPLGGVIFVASILSPLHDREKHVNTFSLSHLISDSSLNVAPPARYGSWILTLYIFNDSALVFFHLSSLNSYYIP